MYCVCVTYNVLNFVHKGKVGWGIAWYINDLLIPEITVQRGTTYTFNIFGGDDQAMSAQYHPFYITDDAEGGYAQKTAAEQAVSFVHTNLICSYRTKCTYETYYYIVL